MRENIRLYLDQPLSAGQALVLEPEQAHYLFSVMRVTVGDVLRVFNGADGEWRAEVTSASKRGGQLSARAQIRPQTVPADLWLIFSPIKKERTYMIVEKAVELGAARVIPAQMQRTNGEKWRADKHQAHMIEAAEQCGATYVPELAPLKMLESVLRDWPQERILFWADEELAAQNAHNVDQFIEKSPQPAAILIGPEGGFSPDEQAFLRGMPFVRPLKLGPRILRAETAAIAAMTLWQARLGDWR